MLESQLAYVVRSSLLEATSRPLLTPIPVQFAQCMRFGEDCFLRSPEWQALLFHKEIWPFQATQPRGLTRKNRLMRILVNLPPLVAAVIDPNLLSRRGWKEQVDEIIAGLLKISADVKDWLFVGTEQVMLVHPGGESREQLRYPDILAGVTDCVSHRALLQIDEALRYLYRMRSRSNSGTDGMGNIEPGATRLLADPKTVEGWRQRMIDAFVFVKAESEIAAKPLDFGLTCTKFNLRPP